MSDIFYPYLDENTKDVARYFVSHWKADPTAGIFNFAVRLNFRHIHEVTLSHDRYKKNPYIDKTPQSARLMYAGIYELASLDLLEMIQGSHARNWQIRLMTPLKAAVIHDFYPYIDQKSGLIDTKRIAEAISEHLLPKLSEVAALLKMSIGELRDSLKAIEDAVTETERESALRKFLERISMTGNIFAIGQAATIFAKLIAAIVK